MSGHLSHLLIEAMQDEVPLNEEFLDEQLFALQTQPRPWHTYIVNYKAMRRTPPTWSKADRNQLFQQAKFYVWEDPLLFKIYVDQVVRRCVPEEVFHNILSFCHTLECGGHFGGLKTTTKVLQCGFYWPALFWDAHDYCKSCERCH
jgi:hypothetical protein